MVKYMEQVTRSVSSVIDGMVARKSPPLKGIEVTVMIRNIVTKERKDEKTDECLKIELKAVIMAPMMPYQTQLPYYEPQ